MKKRFSVVLCVLLVCILVIPAMAASDAPEIILEPQSPNYPEYSVASYTVKATGTNLRATWYLSWQGGTYNLSDNTNGIEPWEGYAGETYGATFEGASIKGYTYQTDCLMEVKSGAADFAVLDAQLAKSYCGKGDYADLKVVEDLSSEVEYYAIGFKKGSELTAQVNAQLEALAADGTIKTLAEKYGVANTAITDFSDQK